jgi:hypothetical protein
MMYLLVFLACRAGTQHEGTIVGNPGDASTKLAESTDVGFYSAVGFIQSASVQYQGEQQELFLGEEIELERDLSETSFDFLNPEKSLLIPAGTWDSMTIYFSEIMIDGEEFIGGREFSLYLTDIEIRLDGQQSFGITEQEYILEIGRPDWIDTGFITIIEEEIIIIDQESPYYLDIIDPVVQRTGLYSDADGDGEISTVEREEENVAYTEITADELQQDDTGMGNGDTGQESKTVSTCGCNDTSMNILLVPIVLFGLRRRKD